jgi:hypothetical protein
MFARDFVSCLFAGRNRYARHPELFVFGSLQIIPNGFAVGAEKFVSGDFHVHRAFVHQLFVGTVRANRSDVSHFVPGTFVAKHHQRQIGWRKLSVIEPITHGAFVLSWLILLLLQDVHLVPRNLKLETSSP